MNSGKTSVTGLATTTRSESTIVQMQKLDTNLEVRDQVRMVVVQRLARPGDLLEVAEQAEVVAAVTPMVVVEVVVEVERAATETIVQSLLANEF